MGLYRCNQCGNEWDSQAKRPQCSNADCRTTDVDPVEDDTSEPAPAPAPDGGTDGGAPDGADDASASGGLADVESSYEPPDFSVDESTVDVPADMTGPPGVKLPDSEGDDADREVPSPEGGAAPGPAPGPEMPELSPADVELAFKATFDLIAMRRGEHWELKPVESERMSEAYAPVLNKYAPYMMKEHAVEAMAAIVSIQVLTPRLKEDQRQADEAQSDDNPDEVFDQDTDLSDAEESSATEDEPADGFEGALAQV